MSDASYVIVWWLTIFVVGTAFLPFTLLLLNRFADKGYIFTKVLGILIASYSVWFLASTRILPFTQTTIILILLGGFLSSIFLIRWMHQKDLLTKLPFGLFLFEESLFLTALSFWSFVRATEPSIHGLEKFMDFGFVNSILRSRYFPPLDMWLAKSPDYSGGYFINYYYFGHYITAFLTKLSNIDSTITYNLSIATLFALTLVLSFSLGLNLYSLHKKSHSDNSQKPDMKNDKKPSRLGFRIFLAGILAAFLVTLGGNLHTIYVFTTNYLVDHPVPPWQLPLGYYPERYWYPNATRFIPFTIHEFPIYSFVVADLHGHVSDIPFVLFTLAILLAIITKEDRKVEGKQSELKKEKIMGFSFFNNFLREFEEHTSIPLANIFLLGILLSVMYMTNAWDGLIYMILTGLVILYKNLRKKFQDSSLTLAGIIYKTFSACLFLLFFFLVANLPFSLNFKPFVSGIGVLCAPSSLLGKKIGPLLFEVGKCQKSPLWMLAILWGFFYFNVIGYLFIIILPAIKSFFTGIFQHRTDEKFAENRNKNESIGLFDSFFARLTLIKGLTPVDMLILIMIFVSTLLLIFPEFFYMKDIYPMHYRANTMFKLGYQAFIMLGLCSSFIAFRAKDIIPQAKKTLRFILYNSLFIFLFVLVGVYPYFAINSYYGGLQTYHGLFGLNWFSSQYPDDYKAIIWLRQNIKCRNNQSQCNNHPVIAEANGDSYTDYARVSANTGLPTIIGWPVHEWLWRGSYDEAGRRIPEVAALYESPDINLTKGILQKYDVEYIFDGTLEREKYKNLDETKLLQLGTVVFQSGNTKIIKVSPTINPL
ncbi:DUF2298 domain-containing protein [Patescibacteria group bacterium]|nr:DUF2298 domain-containing protein [Patescibacteria group bacterium]MCL5798456.1 DUF2298 domain-containing protein [Patescibacteria group bacterium]